ncbi:MAG TPA: hypothetical protein VED22_01195 [Nitrososphaerales archaeon]|nr:hypothetical protein [Nitrososphaerales archaeon]
MKLWIPIAVGAVIIIAYTFFYMISATEPQGATSFDLTNSIGLIVVLVGVVAAGLVIRRASPSK